jgi:hypothetical protein
MISAMRRLVSLCAVFFALAACAIPAFASGGANRLAGDCIHSLVKPSEIILACADGNAAVDSVKWTSFGGAVATGTGVYGFNDCTPNCVSGKVHSYPAKLAVAKAQACPDGFNDYRSLKLTFTGKPPKGYRRVFKTKLFCPLP